MYVGTVKLVANDKILQALLKKKSEKTGFIPVKLSGKNLSSSKNCSCNQSNTKTFSCGKGRIPSPRKTFQGSLLFVYTSKFYLSRAAYHGQKHVPLWTHK